ncbi:CIC11C00000001530 [Sungouiella intermedia]|uniref:CIC11C00000001530 n=1 Tax=Sungouiella intermedia TaxID=45354 RepID=A0A1L0DD76_9ASCO|nr:CIC11C00000005906 [[Candida] intermedia]SGZ54068.1 CIC11C00000001530 [[Candida] intermedia]
MTQPSSYQEKFSETNAYDNEVEQLRWQDFKDSFKRVSVDENDSELSSLDDIERANLLTSKSPLQRKLKSRNIAMIAIGSSIGSALFVGSGSALSTGGPAGILIAWSITGFAIFTTMQSLGELSVAFPVSGGFNLYASRFIDPSVGFSVAWNYFIQFLVLLPLELVSSSITMQFWNSSINPDIWVLIFYVVVCSINMFGVRAYGEAEFVFSVIKVVAVVGFIIVSIVLVSGGGPSGDHHGAEYWHNPGAFANGFKGVVSVFVTAAFAYAGVELCGLAAAESENPRKALPRAIKQVFWRILMFYLVSLTLICFLVPYNSERLLGASSVDVTASPFVIAIELGGIKGLPHVMNAVILVSVISVASTSVYASSRTLTSLAEQGLAPKICAYVDRAGRPLVAILISNVFALLAFIAASGKESEVFTWLLSISALSSIALWISINWAHIRFRRGLKAQGRSTNELTFVAQTGVIGSYIGGFIFILVLIAQFWIALYPIGSEPSAYGFFLSYLGGVILVVFYLGHKVWKKNWIFQIPAKDLDLDSGRRETDLELLREQIRHEKAVMGARPWYIRFYHLWC